MKLPPPGDHISNISIKSEPVEVEFNDLKSDDRAAGGNREATLSINMNKPTLILYNTEDTAGSEKPLELGFQPKYGNIVKHKWYGDGYMVLCFNSGFFVVVSTHSREIGQEIYSASFQGSLVDISMSEVLHRAAVCSDSKVYILDVKNGWKDIPGDAISIPDEVGMLETVRWSPDGQILTLSTKNGNIYNYLARIPNLTARFGSSILYLSSLRTLAVADVNAGRAMPKHSSITVGMEPAFVAVGPGHVAVGGNNRAWVYRIQRQQGLAAGASGELAAQNSAPVSEREYIGTVDRIALNSRYIAALSKNLVQVHLIEGGDKDESWVFPDNDEPMATCMALTEDFLIYGTKRGAVRVQYLREGQSISDYSFNIEVTKIFPNNNGTRVVVVLANRKAYVYSPANDEVTEIPDFPSTYDIVLWDLSDWPTFVIVEPTKLTTCVYAPVSISGPFIEKVGITELSRGYQAVLVQGGFVVCQVPGGALESIPLATHTGISNPAAVLADRRKAFTQTVALHRLKTAWELAHAIGGKEVLTELGNLCLKLLDVDTAVKVYRKLGDVSLVLELQRLMKVEDRSLLAGNIALILKNYSLAQDLFLASTSPIDALDMRRDLLDWEQALSLAKTLAPEQIPFISREYGKHLEFVGEHSKALQMFETGLTHDPAHRDHDDQCYAGIARTSIRLGDIRRDLRTNANAASALFRCSRFRRTTFT